MVLAPPSIRVADGCTGRRWTGIATPEAWADASALPAAPFLCSPTHSCKHGDRPRQAVHAASSEEGLMAARSGSRGLTFGMLRGTVGRHCRLPGAHSASTIGSPITVTSGRFDLRPVETTNTAMRGAVVEGRPRRARQRTAPVCGSPVAQRVQRGAPRRCGGRASTSVVRASPALPHEQTFASVLGRLIGR